MKYYENMKAIRIKRGLTQTQVASLMNISQSTYSKYENGKRMIPLNMLAKFCLIVNVSSNYILDLPDNLRYPKNK